MKGLVIKITRWTQDGVVFEDCDQLLTDEMINILKGTHDLTDVCFTHFFLLDGESGTDLALLSPVAKEWRNAEEKC